MFMIIITFVLFDVYWSASSKMPVSDFHEVYGFLAMKM